MNALDGVIFDIRTHNRKILRELKNAIRIHKKLDYTNVSSPVTQKNHKKKIIMNDINISVFR